MIDRWADSERITKDTCEIDKIPTIVGDDVNLKL